MDNTTTIKTLEGLEELTNDELKKIIKKGDMTGVELDNATKAVCLLEKIGKVKNAPYDKYEMSEAYPNWSNVMRDSRRMNRSMGDMSQLMHDDNMSGAHGRSPVTGRRISRGDGNGYSGHSIKDRMIAKLESLYDEADSEYDAVEIRQAIEEIRNGK